MTLRPPVMVKRSILLIEALKTLKVRLPNGTLLVLEPGNPVDFPEGQAQKLLQRAKGRVRPVLPGSCWCCGQTRFWISVFDRLICGTCHPPMTPALVREWL